MKLFLCFSYSWLVWDSRLSWWAEPHSSCRMLLLKSVSTSPFSQALCLVAGTSFATWPSEYLYCIHLILKVCGEYALMYAKTQCSTVYCMKSCSSSTWKLQLSLYFLLIPTILNRRVRHHHYDDCYIDLSFIFLFVPFICKPVSLLISHLCLSIQLSFLLLLA